MGSVATFMIVLIMELMYLTGNFSFNLGYIRSIVAMGSVATFMIVLIMELMPEIKLCVIYRYEFITYETR